MHQTFNYKEFLITLDNYNINTQNLFLPNKSQKSNLIQIRGDNIYLIKTGIVAVFLDDKAEKLYSIFGEGLFLGYYTIFDLPSAPVFFKALGDCELLIFSKKDMELSLSLLPEGINFQFDIMKDMAKHLYVKSLLQYKDSKNKLILAFEFFAENHGKTIRDNKMILPKIIRTKIVKDFCGLSSCPFYKNLSELYQLGLVEKKEHQWIVDLLKIKEYKSQLNSEVDIN
ncbi:Crp/Fnr family transcriptional regulator [Listeria monocytogenes]|nr:Crp/Fnr family transcriptional regulator [Listeria monocytogenes]EHM3395697.1 Crp/Fnr family transcriptional regulator [Listeria monocytogenes]EKJ1381275.1 Crp/Fnr family transcriptional regulator [Listeria monocytogenes]